MRLEQYHLVTLKEKVVVGWNNSYIFSTLYLRCGSTLVSDPSVRPLTSAHSTTTPFKLRIFSLFLYSFLLYLYRYRKIVLQIALKNVILHFMNLLRYMHVAV